MINIAKQKSEAFTKAIQKNMHELNKQKANFVKEHAGQWVAFNNNEIIFENTYPNLIIKAKNQWGDSFESPFAVSKIDK